ncbi:MAG: ABC transporter permease [Mycetocola sp.]
MSTATPIRPASTTTAVRLVAEREIGAKLRSKAFLISTGILMLVVLASVVVSGLLSTSTSTTQVAVVGDTTAISQFEGLEAVPAADRAEAEELVRSGDVSAAIVPDPAAGPLGFVVVADDAAPSSLVSQLSIAPTVELLNPADNDAMLAYFVSVAFGVVFLMSAVTFGATIAQSVVEEKATRVVEILMAAIPVKALLTGKILGNTALAMGQVVLVAATAAVGMMATGQTELLDVLGAPMLWFVVFFLVGFILLAALYSAAAALVSRQEDVGTTTTPVMMLVMIPYFLIIFFNDNPLVVSIMSYVPFSAPVAMPVRMFLGQAEWWEPLLSLVILAATTLVVITIGSRVYRNSLLRTGARVPLGQALRG